MPTGSDLAAFTTVFRAADSHRVKRNRQPVSCIACQRRKSKCDRQKPCGACEKRGDVSACRFGTTTSTNGRLEVQARLAKLEEMVKDLAASGPKDSGGQDEKMSQAGEHQLAPGDGAPAKYHGATSWAALVQSIHEIQDVLQAEDDLPPPPEEPEQEKQPAPDIFLGDLPKITIKEILSSLPDQADADRLVTTYFNAKFLAVPFIHVHHFRRRYDAFWKDPYATSFTWLSIMFSILSIGAMIAKVKSPVGSTPPSVEEPKYYMGLSSRCLITGEYLKAKVFSVEAIMMFAHARNVQKEDSDSTIWAFFGLAVRLAQRRGYHLEASNVSDQITPFEAEMRRRTWFMIQSCDLLFSFQLGMPPMIYQSVCNIGHPLNLLDHDFDEGIKELPPARPQTDPTPILGWHIKSQLSRLTRAVIQHVLCVDPQPYEKTMELNAKLEDYHANIPPCYRSQPIRDTSFTEEGYTIMHRLILELMYQKTLCVLHRPFLEGKTDAEYGESRDICRRAALRILDLHLEFDQEIRPGGRMYDDRFMVSSLTLHDFLVAAMIICLDLSASSDLSPSDRRKRISVLQQAHVIWTERSVKSKDARHACKVLSAILNKVESPQSLDTSLSEGSTLVAGESPFAITDPYAPPDLSPMHISEYPVNFDELLPLDTFFTSAEGLDWNTIDNYIRHGTNDLGQPDELFPDGPS